MTSKKHYKFPIKTESTRGTRNKKDSDEFARDLNLKKATRKRERHRGRSARCGMMPMHQAVIRPHRTHTHTTRRSQPRRAIGLDTRTQVSTLVPTAQFFRRDTGGVACENRSPTGKQGTQEQDRKAQPRQPHNWPTVDMVPSQCPLHNTTQPPTNAHHTWRSSTTATPWAPYTTHLGTTLPPPPTPPTVHTKPPHTAPLLV